MKIQYQILRILLPEVISRHIVMLLKAHYIYIYIYYYKINNKTYYNVLETLKIQISSSLPIKLYIKKNNNNLFESILKRHMEYFSDIT